MGVTRYSEIGALVCKLKHALRDREVSDLGTVPKGRKVVSRKQTESVLWESRCRVTGLVSRSFLRWPPVHTAIGDIVLTCRSDQTRAGVTLLSIPLHERDPSPPLVRLVSHVLSAS